MLSVPMMGQQFCTYQYKAIEAYQAKDYVLAKNYIDSALLICDEKVNDSYTWHVKGFIEKEIYQKDKFANIDCPNREIAIEAFLKSLELDTIDHEFTDANRKALAFLGSTYNNDAARFMDTINYKKATEYYMNYKRVYKIAKPDFNFTEKELEYNNSLAHILFSIYDNNTELNKSFLDEAIKYYFESLKNDSMNYSANYNLGIIYHNLGVSVIKNMDDEISFEALISSQESAVEHFVKALPHLKRAYLIQPEVENNLTALAAVYISLNDRESSNIYLDQLNVLKDYNEVENELILPKNNYPSWDPVVNYSEGDVIYYLGFLYKAISVSTGMNPSSSSSDWVKIKD
jgi:tetratricopeptide (TPR) repeat protein